jgi:phage-related minor tail protein
MGFFHAQKEVVIHMASRIQGITVEIGGDTTKLSKALESVNKSIKGTQSGLKDVNKLLKLDPSNTELVVQKQKMLKDAIEATKEKLATLKTAAQQANEQLAGSMSSNLTTPVDSLGDWMDSVVGSFATTIKKSQSGRRLREQCA